MRAILDYCTGGTERSVPAGTLVIHEGGKTGHLFVLIEGRLEVVKGDSVVAVHHRARRGARRNVGPARSAAYRDRARAADFDRLRDRRCRSVSARSAGGGAIDRAATGATPQCRDHLSRRPHASICRPRQSPLDGRRTPAKHDQPVADAGLARLGSAIRPKDVSQAGGFDRRRRPLQRRIEVDDCASSADSQNAVPSSMSRTI